MEVVNWNFYHAGWCNW